MAPLPEIVTRFAGRYKPELAAGYSGTLHLIITGAEPGEFTLSLSDSGCVATEGLSGQADCEVRTNSDVFRRIVTHQRSAEEEFIMGNIYISNLQVVLRIGKAFR